MSILNFDFKLSVLFRGLDLRNNDTKIIEARLKSTEVSIKPGVKNFSLLLLAWYGQKFWRKWNNAVSTSLTISLLD